MARNTALHLSSKTHLCKYMAAETSVRSLGEVASSGFSLIDDIETTRHVRVVTHRSLRSVSPIA